MIIPDSIGAGLQVLAAGITSLIEGGVGVIERTASSIFEGSEQIGIAFMPSPLHPMVEINHAFARKIVECWARSSRELIMGFSDI